jgi:hypothetical protein
MSTQDGRGGSRIGDARLRAARAKQALAAGSAVAFAAVVAGVAANRPATVATTTADGGAQVPVSVDEDGSVDDDGFELAPSTVQPSLAQPQVQSHAS